MKSAFQVSICGGGIGGLMLAIVIDKYGNLPVEIFEAGPTITTFGAGMGFYGRTMDIMKVMGLYDEFVQMALGPPKENTGPSFRKSDQPEGYHWFTRKLKRDSVTYHRKDVIDFLFRHVPASCKIHMSKRLQSYDVDSETGKITLHFADGSSSVTDVLVGADGVHSTTRKTMYRELVASTQNEDSKKRLLECIDPVWTGMFVHRDLIPTARLQQRYPNVEIPTGVTMHLGRDKHIVTYAVSQGKMVNVSVYFHNVGAFGTPFEGRWVTDVSEKEIQDQFEDWEVMSQAIVKCLSRPSRWALHVLHPLPHYVHGRVALLGDAIHPMEPHFGAGAGQAIEDAYVLGRLLTHKLTHLGNVADAFKTYEDVRLPFANDVVQQSRKFGRFLSFSESRNGAVPAGSSPEELEYVRKGIEDIWEWQNEGAWVWGEAEARWRAKWGPRIRL